MSKAGTAIQDLKKVARELEDRGDSKLARRVGRAVAALLDGEETAPELLTTGEAAQELGIRSVNTIKRWASQGLLDGFRRGGRVLVSRASVEKMKGHTSVSQEIVFERELDEALDPFDFGDEPVPDLSATWVGRKPWEQNAGTRRNPAAR